MHNSELYESLNGTSRDSIQEFPEIKKNKIDIITVKILYFLFLATTLVISCGELAIYNLQNNYKICGSFIDITTLFILDSIFGIVLVFFLLGYLIKNYKGYELCNFIIQTIYLITIIIIYGIGIISLPKNCLQNITPIMKTLIIISVINHIFFAIIVIYIMYFTYVSKYKNKELTISYI